jgi:hypothetical protein
MEDEYTTFKQQPAMPEREEGGAPEPLPDQASGFEPNPAMNSVTGEKAAARRGACHAVVRTFLPTNTTRPALCTFLARISAVLKKKRGVSLARTKGRQAGVAAKAYFLKFISRSVS